MLMMNMLGGYTLLALLVVQVVVTYELDIFPGEDKDQDLPEKRSYSSSACRRCMHRPADWGSCFTCYNRLGASSPYYASSKRAYNPYEGLVDKKAYNPYEGFVDKKAYNPYEGLVDKKAYNPYEALHKRAYNPYEGLLDKRAYNPYESFVDKKAYNPYEGVHKRVYNPYEGIVDKKAYNPYEGIGSYNSYEGRVDKKAYNPYEGIVDKKAYNPYEGIGSYNPYEGQVDKRAFNPYEMDKKAYNPHEWDVDDMKRAFNPNDMEVRGITKRGFKDCRCCMKTGLESCCSRCYIKPYFGKKDKRAYNPSVFSRDGNDDEGCGCCRVDSFDFSCCLRCSYSKK